MNKRKEKRAMVSKWACTVCVALIAIANRPSTYADIAESPTLQDARLRNVTWHLVAMDGRSFVAASNADYTLRFFGDAVPVPPQPDAGFPGADGFMVCNIFISRYTIPVTETLYFLSLSQTLVDCGQTIRVPPTPVPPTPAPPTPSAPVIDLYGLSEMSFTNRLRQTIRYTIQSKPTYRVLTLYDADQYERLRFTDVYSVAKVYLPVVAR